MARPKISIVVPNRNGGSFLRACLNSIFSQYYENLEVILVDGQSTDESLNIIKDFQHKISHVIDLKPTGLYPALNSGFQCASGDIMAYLNSDDSYLPGALNTVGEIFHAFTQLEWLTGQPTLQNESGHVVMSHPARRWSRLDFALGDYQFIQQESTFWRRSLWQKTGSQFSENYKSAGDLELWSRFFREADLYTFNAPLAAFRVSKGKQQLSQQGDVYARESSEILQNLEPKLSSEQRHTLLDVQKWMRLAELELLPTFLTQKFGARAKFLRKLPPKIIFDRDLYAFKLSDED